jgi:hypothetical protein
MTTDRDCAAAWSDFNLTLAHFRYGSPAAGQPFPLDVRPYHYHRHGVEPAEFSHGLRGAVESLQTLGNHANVVLLTNLPHHSAEARRENLRGHGLEFPVITNSGPKGPAVKALAEMVRGPVVFVDDSPSFIASAYEHAPRACLVHFLHDERFARHLKPADYVSLRTASWDEARPHIITELGGAKV